MNVVVLGSLAQSLVNFRGHLLRRLRAEGHAVTACAGDDDPAVRRELESQGIAFRHVPMARTGRNPFQELGLVRRLVGLFDELKPDVLLTYTIKPVIYGGWAAARIGVPRRIAMITGAGAAFCPGGVTRRVLKSIAVGLYRRSLPTYDRVVFQNPDDLAEFASLRLMRPERAVRVWGSGVDLDHFAVAPAPGGQPRFLLIARLIREKGVADFVAAARILKREFPQAVCQLLGPFYRSPSAISERELEEWGGSGAIEYLGAAEDVRPALREAGVFVLPSYYREGVPRSIQEAMAIGRPIVTTGMPGCRETVIDGRNGFLVPPRDPAALATAMLTLARSPELRMQMGAESRHLAEQRFDVHVINDVLADLLVGRTVQRAAA